MFPKRTFVEGEEPPKLMYRDDAVAIFAEVAALTVILGYMFDASLWVAAGVGLVVLILYGGLGVLVNSHRRAKWKRAQTGTNENDEA